MRRWTKVFYSIQHYIDSDNPKRLDIPTISIHKRFVEIWIKRWNAAHTNLEYWLPDQQKWVWGGNDEISFLLWTEDYPSLEATITAAKEICEKHVQDHG